MHAARLYRRRHEPADAAEDGRDRIHLRLLPGDAGLFGDARQAGRLLQRQARRVPGQRARRDPGQRLPLRRQGISIARWARATILASLAWREQRTVSNSLTLQYDKVLFPL